MEDIKVLLTIKIMGGQLLSEEEAKAKNAYSKEVVNVNYTTYDKKAKKKVHKKETLVVSTRAPRIITQSIKINRDAYIDMINKPIKGVGKNKRLEIGLLEITQALGGFSFEYEVLED